MHTACMDAVLLIGIQGAGKSSFYWNGFRDTHVRINLDMLRTRRRETLLLQACLEAGQPFVVDNTNATASQRARYIEAALRHEFKVRGFLFRIPIELAIQRNASRPDAQRVPVGEATSEKRLLKAEYELPVGQSYIDLLRSTIEPSSVQLRPAPCDQIDGRSSKTSRSMRVSPRGRP